MADRTTEFLQIPLQHPHVAELAKVLTISEKAFEMLNLAPFPFGLGVGGVQWLNLGEPRQDRKTQPRGHGSPPPGQRLVSLTGGTLNSMPDQSKSITPTVIIEISSMASERGISASHPPRPSTSRPRLNLAPFLLRGLLPGSCRRHLLRGRRQDFHRRSCFQVVLGADS